MCWSAELWKKWLHHFWPSWVTGYRHYLETIVKSACCSSVFRLLYSDSTRVLLRESFSADSRTEDDLFCILPSLVFFLPRELLPGVKKTLLILRQLFVIDIHSVSMFLLPFISWLVRAKYQRFTRKILQSNITHSDYPQQGNCVPFLLCLSLCAGISQNVPVELW